MSTGSCASLTLSPSASASTYAFDSASVSTSVCASRMACRRVPAHISVCRLAYLLHPCLRLSQRVDHCLRKSASMSTSGCASVTVPDSAFASSYAFDLVSVSITACASRPACRQVAVHRSVCRLAFLPNPKLESQEACPAAFAQVGQRVDHCLRIAQCVA